MTPDSAPNERRSFRSWFASGGYVLVLVVIIAVLVLAWQIQPILEGLGSRAIGDGETVESYGFPLEPLLVPREVLAAAGFPKDGLKVPIDPEVLPARLANDEEALGTQRGKYVVPGQRVIGVEIDGEARAYPLRYLNWHEVINDTLGGRPILVTYSPLCDAAVVFDREVDGEVLEFGISGLVANSNTLFYDKRESPDRESLWSQVGFRAISGPAAAAGLSLRVLPAVVEQWASWVERHPDTTIIKPDAARLKIYRRNPFNAYYGDDRLRFPVSPLPGPESPLDLKDRVASILVDGSWHVVSYESVRNAVQGAGTTVSELGGERMRFTYREDEDTLVVREAETGNPLPVVYTFWFAWHAFHGGPQSVATQYAPGS